MPTKISQLEAATDVTASDLIQIIDIEDTGMATSGTNKKCTAQLMANELAKIINDGAVITANTSTDAVRITQTGAGNALVIEDSSTPDNTPFIVNGNGQLIIGRPDVLSESPLRTITISTNSASDEVNNGNIGIGTSTPISKLHVAGDLTMSSSTTATSATAGTNGDVPAQVAGYLVVNINGTARKIPYYA